MTNPITLSGAVRQAVLYQLNNLHTCLPAAIVSYDFTVQKATVQPLLNKVWADGTTMVMPLLENVPVVFPRSGGASLTFPVNSGDTCMLLFSERSMDLWLSVGGQVNPDDNRKFDLSDAIAIMGLYPFSQPSQAINNTDVLLTFQNSSITIKANGDIVINTAGTIALGNSVTELLDVVSQILGFLSSATAFTVPSTPFTGPFNFSAATAILQTQLDAIKGTIP